MELLESSVEDAAGNRHAGNEAGSPQCVKQGSCLRSHEAVGVFLVRFPGWFYLQRTSGCDEWGLRVIL